MSQAPSKELTELQSFIQKQPMIDIHENLITVDQMQGAELDLFDLLAHSYVRHDLTSAGLPPTRWSKLGDEPEAGWNHIKPYLDAVRPNASYQVLLAALKDLYGLEEDLNDNNWAWLSAQIRGGAGKKGWYDYVFRKRAGVHMAINVTSRNEADNRYFAFGSNDLFRFIRVYHGTELERMQKQYKQEFDSLGNVLDVMDSVMQKLADAGAVCLGCPISYFRTLRVDRIKRSAAEKLYKQNVGTKGSKAIRQIEDFLISEIVDRAAVRGLPIQVHIGFQPGVGNKVHFSDPLALTYLLSEFPAAKVVLNHGGYPYSDRAIVVAKTFPNVSIDFSWMPILSPGGTRRFLEECLEMVPANKIMWGGACRRLEEMYGATKITRQIFAEVLSDRVAKKQMELKHALSLTKAVFYDNAKKLFHLQSHPALRAATNT